MWRLKDASRMDNHITPSCYGCVINAKHTQIWIWQCKRTVYYFPCDKTIHRICRKDRPMFWSFKASVFIRRDSNWSPTILSMRSMFISRRFINKYQLISIVACHATYPVCPEFRILLCSAYLHLQSQKWHENGRKSEQQSTFSLDHLTRFKIRLMLCSDTQTWKVSHRKQACSSIYMDRRAARYSRNAYDQ